MFSDYWSLVRKGTGAGPVSLGTRGHVTLHIGKVAGHEGSVELLWAGAKPPVHVYSLSILNENLFKISISVQNFIHFDI